MNSKPIGIFDSGIGGLTVLKEVVRAMPNEDVIYFGDTARVPYGNKSKETVIRYSLEIADFLVKKNVKALVVACNTATAFALTELKQRLNIPVIGVIEAGAKAAVAATTSGRIGVIGTEGTIRSGAYFDAIKAVDSKVAIFMQPCPLFVPLAEEGWTNNEVTKKTAAIYMKRMQHEHVDTIVLGCTHYPLLKPVIAEIMGMDVEIIDSAYTTAANLKLLLQTENLQNGPNHSGSSLYYVTDSPDRFADVGRKFLDNASIQAELVTIGGV